MEKFNLLTKFDQIANCLNISNNEKYNFLKYLNYFKNKKDEINILKNKNFSFNKYSELIERIIDNIFLFKYIENNYINFNTKVDKVIANNLKNNGFQISDNEKLFKRYKTDKDIILNIYFTNNKKDTIRINFNLLDKKYYNLNLDFYKMNLCTVVDAIDKYNFKNYWLDVKNQTNYKDKLFALITIELNQEELCENSYLWVMRTPWAMFYNTIDSKIKDFCKKNNVKYHFPYALSIKWINDSLKNINFTIKNLFLKLQRLFIAIRIKSKESKSIDKTLELFKNTYFEINKNLNEKIDLLNQLIYLNKISNSCDEEN